MSYEKLIEDQGVKIIAQAHDNDYQGDSILLVQGEGGIGLLIFGWGSCSGCDAYEAAWGDEAQLQELAEELIESIQWFPTITEAEDYILNGKDWEGTWLNADLIERFKTEVITL